MSVVRLERANKLYRKGPAEVAALRDVDLDVAPGEWIAIMGSSGSGKSTMLNLLGLLDRPTTGRVIHGDHDVADLDDDALSRLRNRAVGFIFQSFHLFPQLNVVENIEVPMAYAGTPPALRRARARELAERVGLAARAAHRPRELSGGEMQRVAIARALANEPRLLLADEPTGNLDEATSGSILDLLAELHARGSTLVVVTHNPEIGARARRCIRLRDGRVVA